MPAERARHSLRQLLSTLRREADLVRTEGEMLLLDAALCSCDAADFCRGAPSEDCAALERAANLYAGPLLEGFAPVTERFEEWLRVERARLSDLAAGVLKRLALQYAAAGDHEAAARAARRLLAGDPTNEEACRALMHALEASGRRNAALEQYRACREALARQLGVEPEPATRELHDRLAKAGALAQDKEAPARLPVLAVLPIANLANASGLDGLAASLCEDLSGHLARTQGFEVLAQSAVASAARESGSDVRRVARTLGARYVITGSLRQPGPHEVRASIQIVDGESAQYLWSAVQDLPFPVPQRELDDFAVTTVARIEQQLTLSEAKAGRHGLAQQGAWDKMRQGRSALYSLGWSEEAVDAAVRAFREAIAIDPSLAIARAQKAVVMALASRWGLLRDEASRDEARADAEKALEMEPTRSEVLGLAGCAIADLGDTDRALPLLERAIEENPDNAQAWAALGATHLLCRRLEPGIEALRRGLRISPTDYRRAIWLTALGRGLAGLDRLEEALEAAQGACRSDANFYPARIVLAMVHAKSGRTQEAAKALAEAKRLRPRLSLAQVRLWAGRALEAAAAELRLPERHAAGV